MELTIVIPVKDDLRIKECINSIDEDVEVIVALNGATDEFERFVSNLGVRIVKVEEANLSKAYNIGIENALNENILLMDSDCLFEKGCIRRLYDGLKYARISKGEVVFRREGIISETIARVREFTTSDFCNAYSPPLVFNKSIVNEIGYYFNPNLNWEEDFDFNYRIKKNKLKIFWDRDAKVYHPALKIMNDLKSAYNYGTGHFNAVKLGLYEETVIEKRQLKKINRIRNKILTREKGFLALIYYKVWFKAYKIGYIIQQSKNKESAV